MGSATRNGSGKTFDFAAFKAYMFFKSRIFPRPSDWPSISVDFSIFKAYTVGQEDEKMPYANEIIGVYKLVNTRTNECYVGGSKRVKKRVAEHFRLLRAGGHHNSSLQEAFDRHGEACFSWSVEVECSDAIELDYLEEHFLQGRAFFEQPCTYNISNYTKKPMCGRHHTPQTRQKLQNSLKKSEQFQTIVRDPAFIARCTQARHDARMNNPEWVAKLKFILDNDHLSYAERGRRVSQDTSSVRRLYLNYLPYKGEI